MKLRKEQPAEIDIKEAADLIMVSEKTIRNYIKLKKIAAVKVGKTWFIDKASLLKFGENYGPENVGDTPEKDKPSAENASNKQDGSAAVHKLACYRLFLIARDLFDLKKEEDNTAEFVKNQSREVIALLGAGYYAYGRSKKFYYESARGTIGKIIAVVAADQDLYHRQLKAIKMLENDVIPAFGALMRKLDRAAPDQSRKAESKEQQKVPLFNKSISSE